MTLPSLNIKDYVIAGLLVLGLFLFANTYLSFNFLFVHWEGWKPRAERLQLAINEAAKESTRVEIRYIERAKEADDAHEVSKIIVRDAVVRYVDRVRTEVGICPAPESSDPRVSESVSADPYVPVRQSEVQRCADTAAYAVDAHNWAVETFK